MSCSVALCNCPKKPIRYGHSVVVFVYMYLPLSFTISINIWMTLEFFFLFLPTTRTPHTGVLIGIILVQCQLLIWNWGKSQQDHCNGKKPFSNQAELSLQHSFISISLPWCSFLVFSGFKLYFQGCTVFVTEFSFALHLAMIVAEAQSMLKNTK